ncbi:MAG: phosphatidate cytidylyltransferase [Opitutae bacterium]|jgi:phosphatidate cytidylyltransferase|nr:phosphatidate cytidylyltransferase [Opitutae bacterium]MBT5914898.1 phosphatidate cytidylyltransferase [Opitutae bacterium]MBT7405730.1 phosphatidate cytidylyltransferase [Opitutae bacterium]
MILRSFSTILLWGLVALVVYSLKETGAMWILNLCATLTLFEVYTILGRLGYAANRLSGLITGGCLIPVSYYFEGYGVDVLAIGALFTSAACVLFPQAQRGMYIKRLMPTFFGLLFVSFLLQYFVRILQIGGNENADCFMGFGLFFSLWVVIVAKFSDIGALLIGKAIGRTKMAPSISPGKTIEGLIGGFAASAGIGALLPWLFQEKFTDIVFFGDWIFTPGQGAIWGTLLALSAVIGDLIASVLKRLASMKDSGGAIPGIGGLFDLTDSLILAAPTGYFILFLLR